MYLAMNMGNTILLAIQVYRTFINIQNGGHHCLLKSQNFDFQILLHV